MRAEQGEGGRGKEEREVPGSRSMATPCGGGEQQQVRMRVSGGTGGGVRQGAVSRRRSCVDEPCGGRVRKGRTRAQEKSNDLKQDQGGPGGEDRSDPWRQIQPDADWPGSVHEESKGTYSGALSANNWDSLERGPLVPKSSLLARGSEKGFLQGKVSKRWLLGQILPRASFCK